MDHQDGNPRADSGGPPTSNEFHITGNVGAIATGPHGQATGYVYSSGGVDPLELIDQLLSKLAADASLLPADQADEVRDDVQRLHTEVHSRRPSAESIRTMISRLTNAASSTAALLASVEQIRDLVTAILH
jgi:hypothetical protein